MSVAPNDLFELAQNLGIFRQFFLLEWLNKVQLVSHGASTCLSVKAHLLDLPFSVHWHIYGGYFAVEAHLAVVGTAPVKHFVVLVEGC